MIDRRWFPLCVILLAHCKGHNQTSQVQEIGTVNPQDFGAKFNADDVASNVFCLRKILTRDGCATAVMISKEGYFLTNYHVGAAVAALPSEGQLNQAKNGVRSTTHCLSFDRVDEACFAFEVVMFDTPSLSEGLYDSKIGDFTVTPLDAVVLKVVDADLKDLTKDINRPFPS